MGDRWTLSILTCIVLVVLITSCLQCGAEIHRAKASVGSRPHRPHSTQHRRAALPKEVFDWRSFEKVVDATKAWLWSWTSVERIEIWTCSIVASAIVGLSGIFPLLVIPLETGEALRRGASANEKLKLLLSFAVGGLLGDVFLHLLPEAWAHVDKLGGEHNGSIEIGVWIIIGLLTFMIIEKIFPESSEEDNSDENHHKLVKKDVALEKDAKYKPTGFLSKVSDCVQNGFCGTDLVTGMQKNGSKMNGHFMAGKGNGVTSNGHVKNGKCPKVNGSGHLKKNGYEKNGHRNAIDPRVTEVGSGENVMVRRNKGVGQATEEHKTSEDEESSVSETLQSGHIKTCGWLNLLANMIDNFTHGLAVAGSFSVGIKTGLITTFAILLHEIPHEIGDFAILLRAGFDRWKAAKAQLLTATGGMLGAVAALSAESAQSAGDRTAWILPFTSGGFIYIALVTVLPDLLQDSTSPWQSLKQFALLCTGIAVMAFITIFVD